VHPLLLNSTVLSQIRPDMPCGAPAMGHNSFDRVHLLYLLYVLAPCGTCCSSSYSTLSAVCHESSRASHWGPWRHPLEAPTGLFSGWWQFECFGVFG
jgi:hypothetical protein